MQINPKEIAPGAYQVILSDSEQQSFADIMSLEKDLIDLYGYTIAAELGADYSWFARSDWTHLLNYAPAQGEFVGLWHTDFDERTNCSLIIYNVKPNLDSAHGARIRFRLDESKDSWTIDIKSPVDAILMRADAEKFQHSVEPLGSEKVEQRNILLYGFKNWNNVQTKFNLGQELSG